MPFTIKKHITFKLIFTAIPFFCLTIFPDSTWAEHLQEGGESLKDKKSFIDYLDHYHAFLENRVNEPAVWFDNFFGDPRTDEEELPTSFVRLRISTRYTEGEGFEFPIRLRANVKLPKASDRLRLIILGENPEEFESTRAGDDLAQTTGEESEEDRSSVGLRYTLYKTLRSKLHFGGGTSNLSPFEYYFRVGYRRFIHIGNENIVNLRQSGFWNSLDGYGETSRIDLERILSPKITGRLSFFGTYYDDDPDTEKNNGLNWGAELNFFRHISRKTASSFELGAYGVTRPEFEDTNYRIAIRTRANILRPWFFMEITPEVTFPLSEEEKRQSIGALTVMMEVQFVTDDWK